MNGEYTDREVKVALETHRSPLSGIEELGSEWRLGSLTVDKKRAAWRMGWGGNLTAASRLHKLAFHFPETNQTGHAVIFRSFDKGDSGLPEEFFVGWVPAERESDADGWITFLNREIKDRLAGKPSISGQKGLQRPRRRSGSRGLGTFRQLDRCPSRRFRSTSTWVLSSKWATATAPV
jgi:hypothetical protein